MRVLLADAPGGKAHARLTFAFAAPVVRRSRQAWGVFRFSAASWKAAQRSRGDFAIAPGPGPGAGTKGRRIVVACDRLIMRDLQNPAVNFLYLAPVSRILVVFESLLKDPCTKPGHPCWLVTRNRPHAVAASAKQGRDIGKLWGWQRIEPSTFAPNAAAPKWRGKCPHCNAWNTLEETVESSARRRRPTGMRRWPAAVRCAACPRSRPARRRASLLASMNSTVCWAAAWWPAPWC